MTGRRPTILKLGGSAITDKSQDLKPNLVTIHRAIDSLVGFKDRLVLLHGGGSFAHPFATRAHVQDGYKSKTQFHGLMETELYLDQLSRIVQVALMQRGIGFAPLRPMSYLETNKGRISRVFFNPVEDALDLGLIPLSHGDVVFDSQIGFSIVSADQLASLFAVRLKALRVLFGSDVDGVYTSDPKRADDASLVKEVTMENYQKVRKGLDKGSSRDATGGMLNKFDESLRLARTGCESIIFNLKRAESLELLLSGRVEEVACTRFRAWK
ncbi:MAG TPA: isopentenyl phosphate kinase, partial [Candidatus Binatus sp.]|nr:isopentenyl phosphate kinase [Candidatus Binatus sp.]